MADKTQNIIYGANQTNLLESYDLGDMIGEYLINPNNFFANYGLIS